MQMDSYLSGFLLVAGCAALSILGLLAVRRTVHARGLISSHDVGGYLLSVVGTLYAVILGLIVVDSMGKFQQAIQTTEQEANSLTDVILLADHLPRERRERVRALAGRYVALILDDEWSLMDRGRHVPEARQTAIDLVAAVCDFEPTTEKEKAIHAAQIAEVGSFWDNRRTRTVTAAHGIAPLEWVVLILGGVITVSFTYFFRVDHLRIQLVMTAMVSTIIALNLFLVVSFGYPFSGDLKVDPEGFRLARAILETQGGRPDPAADRLSARPGGRGRSSPTPDTTPRPPASSDQTYRAANVR